MRWNFTSGPLGGFTCDGSLAGTYSRAVVLGGMVTVSAKCPSSKVQWLAIEPRMEAYSALTQVRSRTIRGRMIARANVFNSEFLLFPGKMYGHKAESSMHEPLTYLFTRSAAQVVLIEPEHSNRIARISCHVHSDPAGDMLAEVHFEPGHG